jgi:hypothetical protein
MQDSSNFKFSSRDRLQGVVQQRSARVRHASGVPAVQFEISGFGFEMQDSSNSELALLIHHGAACHLPCATGSATISPIDLWSLGSPTSREHARRAASEAFFSFWTPDASDVRVPHADESMKVKPGVKSAANDSDSKLVFLHIFFQELSAALQYCRQLMTSLTASEPAGTSYSSSIVAGMVHLFFFII